MTDSTDRTEDPSNGHVHTIALYATAICEGLLSVCEQSGIDVDTMTFEVNESGDEMSIKHAIALFKSELGLVNKSIATPKD